MKLSGHRGENMLYKLSAPVKGNVFLEANGILKVDRDDLSFELTTEESRRVRGAAISRKVPSQIAGEFRSSFTQGVGGMPHITMRANREFAAGVERNSSRNPIHCSSQNHAVKVLTG
jgi:hypothetical protein